MASRPAGLTKRAISSAPTSCGAEPSAMMACTTPCLLIDTPMASCGTDTPGAVNLVRKIRDAGVDVPLFGFRAGGLIGEAVPSAGETPSQVTGMLNADLRRRASQAFA